MTISVNELFESISIMKGKKNENRETEKPECDEHILHMYILEAKIYGRPKRDGIVKIGMIASSFEEAISIFRKNVRNNNTLFSDLELLSVTKDRQVGADSNIGIYSIPFN